MAGCDTIPPLLHPKVGEIRAEETRREAELLNLLPVDERYNMNREAQVEQVTIIILILILPVGSTISCLFIYFVSKFDI